MWISWSVGYHAFNNFGHEVDIWNVAVIWENLLPTNKFFWGEG